MWIFRKGVLLISAAFVLCAGNCSRKDSCLDSYQTTEGMVLDSGEPGNGGCGWLIQADDSLFYPVNLDDQYKKDQLSVTIAYGRTNEIHLCGIYGGSFPSIEIYCIKPFTIRNEVGIIDEDQLDKIDMDMYEIHSAKVVGDSLRLFISFGGGCRIHQFRLWKLPQKTGDSSTAELFLGHNANGDGCQALLWKSLSFSLKPLRIRGKNQIAVLLRGSPEMSAYYGTYTYHY